MVSTQTKPSLCPSDMQHGVKFKSHNSKNLLLSIYFLYLKSLIENLSLQIFMKVNFKCLYAHRQQIHQKS